MKPAPASIDSKHPIVLFDGVCNLCNGFVQFMIRRDPKAHFRFASLQSEIGQQLLTTHHLATDNIDTVVLIDNGKAYVRSDVALRVVAKWGGLWPLLRVFGLLPRSFRDMLYNFIAVRRYRWFGEKDQCMIPTPELRSRFLS